MNQNPLRTTVLESRLSSSGTLKDILDGSWRPKNPDERESGILSLVEDLNTQGIVNLANAIDYFVDLALFKLICGLEDGVDGYDFEISALAENGNRIPYVNPHEDYDLKHQFFAWIEAQEENKS